MGGVKSFAEIQKYPFIFIHISGKELIVQQFIILLLLDVMQKRRRGKRKRKERQEV